VYPALPAGGGGGGGGGLTTITAVTISGITVPADTGDPATAITSISVGSTPVSQVTAGTKTWSEYNSGWQSSTSSWVDSSTGKFTGGKSYKLEVVVDVTNPTTHEFDIANPPTLPTVSGSYFVEQKAGISATSVTYVIYYYAEDSGDIAITSVTLSGIATKPVVGAVPASASVACTTTGVDSSSVVSVWRTAAGAAISGGNFVATTQYRAEVTLPVDTSVPSTNYYFKLASPPANAGAATPDKVEVAFADTADPTEVTIYLYYTTD